MFSPVIHTPLLRVALVLSAASALGSCGQSDVAPDAPVVAIATASPIKHVIIIVGENRSFDHLFATYSPPDPQQTVSNLLSQQIITAQGTPGRSFAKAHQYQIVSAPNGGRYFSTASSANKALYDTLPPPDVGGLGAQSPYTALLSLPGGNPGLPPQDQYLFGTGGTGLSFSLGPDTRITHVQALPPGPFQLTGPTLPFDSFTSDTVHEFFAMAQQLDCATDTEHASAENPTGCLHDLQSAIATTYDTPPGTVAHDTGQTMAFFNMQQGDAPLLKSLADQYTLSDNYHQPVLGGTGPNSLMLGFADLLFLSDSHGNPVSPPAEQIYDPDPQPGTLNLYTHQALWFDCSDATQPGIGALARYLRSLPYTVPDRCGSGEYWPATNISPAFTPKGAPQSGTVIPPTTQRSIGDVLSAHGIPWKYYGGGFNADGTTSPLAAYCGICNPFEYEAGYPQMVADHMRDVTDLFNDITNGTLPAVSYVKPDGYLDGHPASSKWTLFEAFVANILDRVRGNPELWERTAILITVDEGGGYYDSGFVQPVDFFGTGPRIPMLAVSPFSSGGHLSHVYADHSSFVKFIERNWLITERLSDRSRDNLPDPVPQAGNPYVPRNMPALGDLFDLFHFD